MLRKLLGREHFCAALLVAAALLLTYRDVAFFGRTFLMLNRSLGTLPEQTEKPESDGSVAWKYPGPAPQGRSPVYDRWAVSLFVEPYEYYNRMSFRRGELPLWNPHSGGGDYHVGNGHSGVFDLLQLPIYMAGDSWYPAIYDSVILLRYFLAGFFTYLFARRLKISFWGGVLAGVSMSQMSYAIAYANHTPVKVAALMPLVFYAFQLLVELPRLRRIALAALAVALCATTDFAQMTFLVFQFAGLYFVIASVAQIWQMPRRWRQLTRRLLALTAAALLGLCLSAPMLIPLFENAAVSASDHSANTDIAARLHFPTKHQWTLLIPFRGLEPGWRVPVPLYATAFILALAAGISLWRQRSTRWAFGFFVVVGVLYLCTLLWIPEFRWFSHLPVFRQIGLPLYLSPLIEFCLAILAGRAVSVLDRRLPALHRIVWASLVFGGLAAVLIARGRLPQETNHFASQVRLFFVCAIGPCLIVLLRDRLRRSQRFLGAGLLAALLLEINLINRDVERPIRWHPYLAAPFVEYLKQRPDLFRVYSSDVLVPNTAMAHGIDDIRWLAGLAPNRRLMMIPHFAQQGGNYFWGSEATTYNRFYNLLNTTYFLSVGGPPSGISNQASERPQWDDGFMADSNQFELVYQNEVRIYRNRWAYPRAFVVYRAAMAADVNQADTMLRRPYFDPSRMAVLEGTRPEAWNPALFRAGDAPPGHPAEKITRTSSGSMQISIRTSQPGILMVSDMFAPGWTAAIDGRPAPIFAADVMLRGVYLEPGDHLVELVFRPQSFRQGILCASLSGLILLGFMVVPWLRRRHSNGTSTAN